MHECDECHCECECDTGEVDVELCVHFMYCQHGYREEYDDFEVEESAEHD